MLVVLGFYKRKPGLTHEEFCHHWFDIHAPLTIGIPGIDRYLLYYAQHHLSALEGFPAPEGMAFDGFSEAWYVDADAKAKAGALISANTEFRRHEREFLDLDATKLMFVDRPKVILDKR